MVVHICANPKMVTVSTPKAAFGCPHIMRVTMRVEAPSWRYDTGKRSL